MQFARNTKYYTVLILLALITTASYETIGQQAQIELIPEEIAIGQQSRLTIRVEAPAAGTVIMPSRSDTLTSGIEIVQFGSPDTTHLNQKLISLEQTHMITAWEEGFFAIPPMQFKYVFNGDTIPFASRAVLLGVQGVDVDMEGQYRDIKPIFGIPVTVGELLPWVVGGLVLMGVLLFLVKWLRKRKPAQEQPTIWEKPDVPAHIAAISSLETLRRKELWQKGKIKEYHSELTYILRMYVRKRYGINATEMTTMEIMRQLPEKLDGSGLEKMVGQILDIADLVKFAKHEPAPQDHEHALENALLFVRKTIPVAVNDE